MTYTLQQNLDSEGDQIKKHKVGGICNTHRGDDKWIHSFSEEIWRKKTTWKT